MKLIFIPGIIIFTISSVLFLLIYKKKFNTAFFVSIITLISYLVMYESILVTISVAGLELYWTRWIFYAFSCSLLMYQISIMLKKSPSEKVNMIYLTVLVMVTGALASISGATVKLVFFIISTFVYSLLLLEISKSKEKVLGYIKYYIVFGWSIFPIIFLLSPEGLNLIGNQISAAFYLLLDTFTKIVFYLHIKSKGKSLIS